MKCKFVKKIVTTKRNTNEEQDEKHNDLQHVTEKINSINLIRLRENYIVPRPHDFRLSQYVDGALKYEYSEILQFTTQLSKVICVGLI